MHVSHNSFLVWLVATNQEILFSSFYVNKIDLTDSFTFKTKGPTQ